MAAASYAGLGLKKSAGRGVSQLAADIAVRVPPLARGTVERRALTNLPANIAVRVPVLTWRAVRRRIGPARGRRCERYGRPCEHEGTCQPTNKDSHFGPPR